MGAILDAAREMVALRMKATDGPWVADDYAGYVWGKDNAMVADGMVDDAANPWERLLAVALRWMGNDNRAHMELDSEEWQEHIQAVEDIRKRHEPVIRMRGVGAALPIDENRAFICYAANHAAALAERVIQLEGPSFNQDVPCPDCGKAVRVHVSRPHDRNVLSGDEIEAIRKAAWLEGAREMYLDVQKVFPVTAPAHEYSVQLFDRLAALPPKLTGES